MKVSIVPLVSKTSPQEAIEVFLNKIRKKISSCEIVHDYSKTNINLFAIITGGVESQFKRVFREFSQPYILVFDKFNNSLPAAIEILSFLNNNGFRGELVDIENLSYDFLKKRYPLAGKTLGTIGEPSDWLIASTYSDEVFEEMFKIKVKHIDIKESFESFNSADEREAERLASDFVNTAESLIEVNFEEVKKAFKFYIALKEIIDRYSLDFISVRCFDIIKPLNTTGCVALSRLNSEGITASCEGDLPSAISMEIARLVSGKPGFMANVSYIKRIKNKIRLNLAHCTVPTYLVKKYNLRTHFETGKGVGIDGKFQTGKVTLFRIGGKFMKSAFLSSGVLKDTVFSNNRCRTQIDVEMEKNVENYFLKNPLGNHHIVLMGDYEKELRKFLKNANIDIINK